MNTSIPIPHKLKVAVIDRVILEEVRKGPLNVFGREIKLLNTFLKSYPDIDFWLNLHLGFQLHSLAWFKLPDGKHTLETAWRFYKLEKAQNAATPKNALDNSFKSSTIEGSMVEDVPAPKPKQSVMEWADSTTA
jgi:hypothetical protein